MRRVSGGGGGRPPIYPPVQPPQNYGLEVFDRRQFAGDRRILSGPVSDFGTIGFNDRAQSLRLPPYQTWQVCVDAYFRNCRVVNTDWPDLGRLGMRDRISSARPWSQGGGGVYPSPPVSGGQVVLYDERAYRGRPFTVQGAMASLPGFNGRAESVQVMGGRWELCEGRQFRGRCVTVTTSIPDLRVVGIRNRVESARPLPMPY